MSSLSRQRGLSHVDSSSADRTTLSTRRTSDGRRNHYPKCWTCDHYKRIKTGLWHKPDWQTGAGRCMHPQAMQCKYIHNIIPQKTFFRPKGSVIGERTDEVEVYQI